jgi:aminoglycoside phosphotransferase (APT) family kinase protein
MTEPPPGVVVGAGRAADVYAVGNDRVLRRVRDARYDTDLEARIVRHLAARGFPVPAVYHWEGPDLIMERLDGRDMLADLAKRPWLARRHGRLLGDLHNRLHEIAAPAGFRRLFEPGDRVMHLDLHPGNIMLTPRGPVVIDWTNATAGPGGADVAMAYLIMASSETDDIPVALRPAVGIVRGQLIGQFMSGARDDPWPHIEAVAAHRLTDPNVRPAEATRLRQLAADAARRGR